MSKTNNKWTKAGKVVLMLIVGAVLTLAVIVVLTNVVLPLTLTHGESVVAFSNWTESWKQYTILTRGIIYTLAWYSWPSLVRHFIRNAKAKRINQLNQVTDLNKIDSQYVLIEHQLIQWRPKLIGIFIIYETIMLYSTFS